MRQFICGLLLASIFHAGSSLATDDGDYWWQRQEMQRRQQVIEDANRRADQDRQREQYRRNPC
jgi:hypothetical protein